MSNVSVEPSHMVAPQHTSSNVNVEYCHVNVKPGQGCDNHKMYVPTSDLGPYSKKYCCLYCSKRYLKLVRHLVTVHKDKKAVKKFQALPIGKYIYYIPSSSFTEILSIRLLKGRRVFVQI